MVVEYLYGITWLTPLIFSIIISIITSLISQLSFKFFANNKFLKEGMKEAKELQQKMLKMDQSDKEYQEVQNKLLDLNMKLMSEQFKPTMITMIPFLLLFAYAKSVIPMDQILINFGFKIPLLGEGLKFFGVYFIVSILFSNILRKLLNR
ncbi:MAG: EMC3/TMCO1 family protein [Candidatus Nanoarchaeia archaeon]|nr:EMC3/TMCO1 family protein [Candidatus Nanoarchaeia archaeon]